MMNKRNFMASHDTESVYETYDLGRYNTSQ